MKVDWGKLVGNRKDIFYALIVLFMLIIMMMVGHLTSLAYMDEVRTLCPLLNVTSYNPITGLGLYYPTQPVLGI